MLTQSKTTQHNQRDMKPQLGSQCGNNQSLRLHSNESFCVFGSKSEEDLQEFMDSTQKTTKIIVLPKLRVLN